MTNKLLYVGTWYDFQFIYVIDFDVAICIDALPEYNICNMKVKKDFENVIIENLKIYNFEFVTNDKINKILEFQNLETKKKLIYIYSTRYPQDLNEKHSIILKNINKLYISGFTCDKSIITYLSYPVNIYIQANYNYDDKRLNDVLNNLERKEIMWNVIVFEKDFAFDYNFIGNISNFEQYKQCKIYKCVKTELQEKSLYILYLQEKNNWFSLLE